MKTQCNTPIYGTKRHTAVTFIIPLLKSTPFNLIKNAFCRKVFVIGPTSSWTPEMTYKFKNLFPFLASPRSFVKHKFNTAGLRSRGLSRCKSLGAQPVKCHAGEPHQKKLPRKNPNWDSQTQPLASFWDFYRAILWLIYLIQVLY